VPAGTPAGTTLTFSFGTSTLAAGDYFLYAVATDGAGNTFARYADVPISVGGLSGGVALTLALDRTTVSTGDTLRVDVTASNGDTPVATDVFFGILLPAASGAASGCPGGDAAVFFGPGFGVVVRCVSSGVQTFPALFRNVTIPGPLAPTTITGIFSAEIPAGAPAGTYTVFMLLTPTNGFADGRADAADIVALDTIDFTIAP
jgi:hypothetical protein